MKVHEKVPIQESYDKTGKAPIKCRWIDINKGDEKNPLYRSRLVAKEFKTDVRPDLFAATPPSECLKMLLSTLATKGKSYRLLYADVSRAYFYAEAVRPVYVQLPQEDLEEGDGQRCGNLLMSMYGTRDAAHNWAFEYAETLERAGFKRGVANPCLFKHEEKDVSAMLHGDNFVAVGPDSAVKYVKEILAQKYKIKTEMMGPGENEHKEVRILNRIVHYTPDGAQLEADPRHGERVVKEMCVDLGETSPVPGSKEEIKKW